jgi:regulator of sigma E protease
LVTATLVIGLGILLLRYFDVEGLLYIGMAAVGLGFVVFIHELGHFLVAKACDVHVETFSIGFGPALPGCRFRRGETTYMIGALPLGGYVKMVGEGAESEDHENDPRSFKNKPVWQRMAIISAGVTMNVLLALAFFVYVFETKGLERAPGVVDRVEPGSPAWKLGVHTGDIIRWIGGKGPDPFFDTVRPVVMHSRKNEKLEFVWGPPDATGTELHHAEIEPRHTAADNRPMIGIAPPARLTLVPAKAGKRMHHEAPYLFTSAAAAATPPFEFGDTIIGTTDPSHPGKILALPPDPRHTAQPDYFEFERRMDLLAGQRATIQVRRHESDAVVDVQVPAAYYFDLGLRMRMGKITAIRDNSPASRAGVAPEDIIDKVEFTDASGLVTRFTSKPAKGLPRPKLIEKYLDPVRLPFELQRLAESQPRTSAKSIALTLLRANPPPSPASQAGHNERAEIVLRLEWQHGWRFDNETPSSLDSPLSIPALGLAYRVETRVEAIADGSPASRARVLTASPVKFRKGDVFYRSGQRVSVLEDGDVELDEGEEISLAPGDAVRAFRFQQSGRTPADNPEPGKWTKLTTDQWAGLFFIMQEADAREIHLRLERGNLEVALAVQQDETWPAANRGLILSADKRLQKADSVADAIRMGGNETLNFIAQVYQSIESLLTRRVSLDNFGGPIKIAQMAYYFAGDSFPQFLVFLGIISVNLAVINFLPIPVLDGGHMVFLVYEKLRGRPAPRRVQEAATFVGLAFILCLMVVVVYIDLR